MAEVHRVSAPNGWLVRIAGTVDENFDGRRTFDGLSNTVVFDLDGVDRITSFGVREWIESLQRVNAEYYAFIRCRPSIVTQFNMVADFGVQGQLVSLYVPFECTECGEYFEELCDLRHDYDRIASLDLPTRHCAKCKGELELDDVPEQYFSYVLSKPEPVVPAAAQRLIDGESPAAPQRLTITKEVERQVTALWLSGNLNQAGRIRRLFEGLEGFVVLEFSKATYGTREGWQKLWREVATAGSPRLYLARIPVPLLELPPSELTKPAPDHRIDSSSKRDALRAGFNPPLEVTQASLAQLADDPEVVWSCPRCGADLDLTAELQPWRDANRKILSAHPPQVGALSQRLARRRKRGQPKRPSDQPEPTPHSSKGVSPEEIGASPRCLF